MRQRLGLATALLGDPQVLVLDEPANGLDPEGIRGCAASSAHLAHDQGRTVLVSSHLLAEVRADRRRRGHRRRGQARSGRARWPGLRWSPPGDVLVRSPERRPAGRRPAGELTGELAEGSAPRPEAADALLVRSASTEEVGRLAHRHGIELHELTARPVDLERLFLELTSEGPA